MEPKRLYHYPPTSSGHSSGYSAGNVGTTYDSGRRRYRYPRSNEIYTV
jgi:hypothetical protein